MEQPVETTEVEVVEAKLPKRILILNGILEGGKKKDDLLVIADCGPKSFASQLSYLRLMGKYPVTDDDGVYSIATEEEWDKIKAERAERAAGRKTTVAKTPEARLEAAFKRVDRCEKAEKACAKRAEAEETASEENSLRAQKAVIETRLANIELDAAKVACPDGLPEVAADPETEVESDDDAAAADDNMME